MQCCNCCSFYSILFLQITIAKRFLMTLPMLTTLDITYGKRVDKITVLKRRDSSYHTKHFLSFFYFLPITQNFPKKYILGSRTSPNQYHTSKSVAWSLRYWIKKIRFFHSELQLMDLVNLSLYVSFRQLVKFILNLSEILQGRLGRSSKKLIWRILRFFGHVIKLQGLQVTF